MLQIIEKLSNGSVELIDIPIPNVGDNEVLIKTTVSLVSKGTEKMLIDFGKASLIKKALQQPEKVKEVISKVKTDGLSSTIKAVKNKLENPIPLGYCNVGTVVSIGKNISEFKIGDRVASNGPHAEYVVVPKNLVSKIPENISDDHASFTVIGSIALQGIRLVNPNFGENIVVVGLGLIGLLTAQLLKANGCRVIGLDFDKEKINLAKSYGIDVLDLNSGLNEVDYVIDKTDNIGTDAVIITASNSSNKIISNAAKMCRKRGKIVLVGVVGLNINRSDFYEKEISFQVSCSYGPGRYDSDYEQKGNDYPLPYVRWTENRNFKAILSSISNGNLKVDELISEKIEFTDFKKIYNNLNKNSIASLFIYKQNKEKIINQVTIVENKIYNNSKPIFGIIGAGNFTGSTILPNLKNLKSQIKSIASSKGLSGSILANKFKIEKSVTDYRLILNDDSINTIIITTQHGSHAKFVSEALDNNKYVFVEKPLAITKDGLDRVVNSQKKSKGFITVGFNRRFAPLSIELKKRLSNQPMNVIATMNAGYIPHDSWVHDIKSGGGRIIGEACHFIDLITFLTGSLVKSVCMNSMGKTPATNTDNASILLKYENGSNAVINYFANGSKSYSKERIEVHQHNTSYIIDNWRKLSAFGVNGLKSKRTRQDKGHYNQFKTLIDNIENGKGPNISWNEIYNTSKTTLAAIDSLVQNKWILIK
jgi:predicted dehydrogenase/threonine dehydrogenase-like Zn-dependent dehydrogenase